MKRYILAILFIATGLNVWAQDSASKTSRPIRNNQKIEKRERINSILKQEEEGNLAFTRQTAFGVQLRTNGYGAFLEIGRRKTPRWTDTYTLEIDEIKSHKEQKVSGTQSFFGNSFIYGKANNFYQAKLGYGRQYILGQKGNRNGVAVIGTFQGGLSLGFLKPYYVQALDSTGLDRTISYYQDSATFVSNEVYGSGGFTKGFSELKFRPGLYLKTALRFDFGKFNETISAIEIGVSVEAYAQKVLIMVYNPEKQLFLQGHVAFVFGRRK